MSIGLRTFVQREGTEIRVLGYCVLEKIAKLRLLRIQRFFRVPNKSKNSVPTYPRSTMKSVNKCRVFLLQKKKHRVDCKLTALWLVLLCIVLLS